MKKNIFMVLMMLISVYATVQAQEVGETLTFGEVVHYLPETILTSSTDPTGCGLSDGTMTAVTGMDSYEIRNNLTDEIVGTTETLDNLPAGEYRLTVMYYTCPKDTVFTLTAPDAPIITLLSDATDNIICQGMSINLVAGGGTEYEFSIGGSIVQALSTTATLIIDTLTVDQTVTVRGVDASGCENTASIDVIVNPVPETILVSTQDPSGCGTGDGEGIAVTGMASYEWHNLTTDVVVATTETVSTLPAGSYRLTVQTTAGCVKDTTFSLVGPDAPVVSVESDATENTICAAGMDIIPIQYSEIQLTASSTPAADQYEFLIGSEVIQALSATSTLAVDTLTVNTTITVRAVAASGCEGFATIDIIVNPLPNNQTPTVNTVAVNANTTNERGECEPAMVIGLQNTQFGYSNQLQLAISPFTILDTQVGDGSAIEFVPQTPGQDMRILIMSPAGCSRPVTKQ